MPDHPPAETVTPALERVVDCYEKAISWIPLDGPMREGYYRDVDAARAELAALRRAPVPSEVSAPGVEECVRIFDEACRDAHAKMDVMRPQFGDETHRAGVRAVMARCLQSPAPGEVAREFVEAADALRSGVEACPDENCNDALCQAVRDFDQARARSTVTAKALPPGVAEVVRENIPARGSKWKRKDDGTSITVNKSPDSAGRIRFTYDETHAWRLYRPDEFYKEFEPNPAFLTQSAREREK